MRKIALLLLLIPTALSPQSIQSIWPQQCNWRAGDNPAWAAPNLDDSGCARSLLALGNELRSGFSQRQDQDDSARLQHQLYEMAGQPIRCGIFSSLLIPGCQLDEKRATRSLDRPRHGRSAQGRVGDYASRWIAESQPRFSKPIQLCLKKPLHK